MSRIPLYRQVNGNGQSPPQGAVLECIRPSRSAFPSTTFSLLNHRVVLRLGTRFGASIGARTCSPAGLDSHDGCCTEPAGTSIRTAPAGHRVPGEYGYGPRRT